MPRTVPPSGIRSHGAHRVPAPPPALHGRALVAAVAAGALVAATQTLDTHAADAEDATAHPRLTTGGATLPVPDPPFVPEVLPSAAGQDARALGKAVQLAAKLATEQAAPTPGQPYRAGDGHSLDGWIATALGLLGLPQALAPGVKEIIIYESGGRPDAINLTDSNALAGHPSQGLMQLIPSTYRAYVLPSLRDRPITDPVANITAGLRYMIANYGLTTVLAGGRRNALGAYIGY